MKKIELQQIIKEELHKIITEATSKSKAEAPIFKRLNALEYRELNVSGGPKTAKALEALAKKRGPKYAAGVYHGAVKGSYDTKYASAAYDEMFGNTMSEYEKDVMKLDKIISQEWSSGADIGESKKGIAEAPNRQAAMRKGVTSSKIKGGITKHFNDYKGTETYNGVRELEDILMYYAQDPSQPLDLDEIANTVLDIIDYAVDHAIDDYKQSRDEF